MRISDWSSDVCSSDLAQRRGHEAGNRAWRAEDGPNPLDFTRESVLAKLVRDPGDAGRYVFTVDGSRERRETAVNSLRSGRGHFATMRGLAACDDNLGFYQIGRASCRVRVCPSVYISVIAVSCKKT